MADRNKFEQMLEKLVNEDKKGAEELFHEIVVEKSRTIYENLLEDELADESKDEDTNEATDEDKEVDESSKDEEVDEAKDEDEKTDESKDENVDEAKDEDEKTDESKDEEVDENFAEITPEADDDMGGDPADDMMADIEADADGEEGDDDKGDEDMEDRVVDLEDALDDLKAEFEKMMGDKEEGDDDDSEEAPMDDMGDDEEKEDEAIEPASDLSVEDEVPAFEGTKSQTEQMREYVEKVAEPKGEDNKAKSPVAGKNDMGGTTANIAKGSSEEKGGTVSAPKTEDAGNVNVPGGKASKSMSNAKAAEKSESGADTDSVIGS